MSDLQDDKRLFGFGLVRIMVVPTLDYRDDWMDTKSGFVFFVAVDGKAHQRQAVCSTASWSAKARPTPSRRSDHPAPQTTTTKKDKDKEELLALAQ